MYNSPYISCSCYEKLICCFFLVSKTRKGNYYLDIPQTTYMMKSTRKKLSDQTTWYKPRKNVKKPWTTQLWLTEDISLVGVCSFECYYFWQSFLWILLPQVLFLMFLFSPRSFIKTKNWKKSNPLIFWSIFSPSLEIWIQGSFTVTHRHLL